MAGNSNLSLAIVVKLLTDNFTKGANRVKSTLLTMQRNFLALATAAGAGTLGLGNFLSKMIEVAKETSRANIALKNVSGTTAAFAENQRWLLDVAKKYGVEINALTSGFAKFKASADISNMSLEDQRKIFESVARASVAFGLSAEDQRGIFMALSQMMSKNKVMAEELRLQMAERMPIAIQAMAKAVGVSVGELDALMKQGKVMSADVLPRFADALNELIADPDMNNLNKSLVDLSNTFQQMTKNLGIEEMFKRVVEIATQALSKLADNVGVVMGVVKAALYGAFGKGVSSIFSGFSEDYERAVAAAVKKVEGGERAIRRLAKAQSEYNLAVREQAAAEEAKKVMSVEASAAERQAIEARVANANKEVKEAETKVFKAEEAKKTAAAKASKEEQVLAAQATATGWTRAMNKVNFAVGALWKSLKSMAVANIWSAAIAGATALANELYKAFTAASKTRNAVKNIGKYDATEEMRELDNAREFLNTGDENIRAGALSKINNILGTQLTFEDDINKTIDQRLKLLAAEERLRKAKEDLAESEKYRDRAWADNVRAIREENFVKPLQQAVEEAQREVFRLTGGSVSASITPAPTPTTQSSPVKVEVVNLDFDSSDTSAIDEFGEHANSIANISAAKSYDPAIVQAIANRQRDKSGDWRLSDTEILAADADHAKQIMQDLLNYAQQTGTELGGALTEGIANAQNLDEALRLTEMKDALTEAREQMRDITLDGIESGVRDIDGLVSAFGRLNQVMTEDATAWERIMAIFEVFSQTVQMVIGIIETMAKAREAAAAIEAASAATTVGANTAEAASETGAAVAKQAPGFAALVAVPAAIAAIVAAFAMIPKFANGGIVGGTSTHGDRVLARLNSGEGILTPEGLESLHDAANPRNSRTVQVTGRLIGRGRDLVAVIGTENKYQTRTR